MPIANKNTVSVAKTSTSVLPETNVGKKLANPYTVANMQRALANLATKGDVKKVASLISANHYYIKFMPKNEAELSLLKVDSNLILYPFPLDVKLNKNISNSYREPGLLVNVPTYQYASVTVNYKLPKVAYQILADLYLPNERSPKSKVAENGLKRLNVPEVTVQNLVNEAERIACEPFTEEFKNGVAQKVADPGDCDDEIGDDGGYGGGSSGGGGSNCGAPAGAWRPSGRIIMTDDVLGLIGVEGLKIRARRWFTTYTGITDANGDYCVDGTFTRRANYWFNFERYDYRVDNVFGAGQEINGPKIQASWNYDIADQYNKYCANIFRAAFHYYYKDIQGLHRPPQNSFWAKQLKIRAIPEIGSSVTNPALTWLNIDDFIRTKKYNSFSFEVYGTAIHELAHTAHWDISQTSYLLSASTVSESWATGVQWVLTKMEYPNYAGRYCAPGTDYRNIDMDMIDTPADISYYDLNIINSNYGFGAPSDQVEGYNIVHIQNSMINAPTTWNEWKNNIKNNSNNGTENNLDALFTNWLNY